jgi:hypothetical protein
VGVVRKREELARLLEHLTPGRRPGKVREPRKQMAILEREIAEGEQG